MKFNRTTITFVILSLGLTTIVYLTEIKPKGFTLDNQSEQQEEVAKIFPFAAEDIQEIIIQVDQQIISFQKQEGENSSWQMTKPENFTASEGAIAFLLNLFPPAENKLAITADEQNRKDYGLLESGKTIEVILKNGDKYQMILGNPNFDDTQIYAEVIFPSQVPDKSTIFLVSKSFQYAIERDFEEWKKSS